MKIIEKFPSKRSSIAIKNNFSGDIETAHKKVHSFFSKGQVVNRKHCPLCFEEGNDFYLIAKFDYQGFPCPTIVCPQCSFVFQSTYLDNNALDKNYKKYSLIIRGKKINNLYLRNLFNERLQRFSFPRYEFITQNIELNPEDLVIEIGCNDGVNLYPFKDKGYKTIGFDLDESSFFAGKEKGIDLRAQCFLDWIKSSKNKPKLIILCHFLEHLPDPGSFITQLSQEIDDNCYVFIEVPGIKEETFVNKRSGIINYLQYEHLVCFERATIEYFMNKNNFKTIECNEFVKGLFVKNNLSHVVQIPKTDAFEYLYNLESNWEQSFFRKFRDFVKRAIKLLQKCQIR